MISLRKSSVQKLNDRDSQTHKNEMFLHFHVKIVCNSFCGHKLFGVWRLDCAKLTRRTLARSQIKEWNLNEPRSTNIPSEFQY